MRFVAAAALRKLGRNDDASAAISRANAAAPRDARVQYKLGQHLRSTGDLEAAVKAYAKALELESTHALAAFWLAATRKLISQSEVKMMAQTDARYAVITSAPINLSYLAISGPEKIESNSLSLPDDYVG